MLSFFSFLWSLISFFLPKKSNDIELGKERERLQAEATMLKEVQDAKTIDASSNPNAVSELQAKYSRD